MRDLPRGLGRLLYQGSFQGLTNLHYLIVRGIYVLGFARLLGAESYGVYVYAQSWAILGLGVAGWGLGEVYLTRYAVADREGRMRLFADGLSLRIVLSAMATLAVWCLSCAFETDAAIRDLVNLYAAGIIVRGITNWFIAPFIANGLSRQWFFINAFFLTVEVVAALAVIALDGSLFAIACVQTVVWGLWCVATVYVYTREVGAMPRLWKPFGWTAYLRLGLSIVLSNSLFAAMSSGLVIVWRYAVDTDVSLGYAALGLQLASIAEQLLRSGSAVVLPRLAEAAATQETMPAPFYLALVWDLAFYAGGIGFVVSQAMLAPLVVYAAGASFSEVDDVFVNFGWLIIPLLICFGLRQMLISQGLQARYLVAVIVGSGAESVAVLGWLIWFAPQAKDLLGLLAIGYAGVAMTALVLIKSAPQQIAWTPNATAPLITLMMLLLYSRYHSVDPIMWSVIVTLLLGTSGSLSIRRLLQLVRVPRIS